MDKQHKDSQHISKEMKDFKKDIAQIKEVGRGISGLRKNIQEQHKNNQRNTEALHGIKEELAQVEGMRKEFVSMKADLNKQQESNQRNSNLVKEMQEEINSLRQTVDQQKHTIQDMQKIKDDFNKTSHRTVGEMNKLVEAQKAQVHRNAISQVDGAQRIRVQADLPKQLRDDVTMLYRVARAASVMDEYKTAKVRDYALSLNGELYSVKQLEQLPYAIRPSNLTRLLPFSQSHVSSRTTSLQLSR